MNRAQVLTILNGENPRQWNDVRAALGELPSLESSIFEAPLIDVDLSRLELGSSTFTGAKLLVRARFDHANLSSAKFAYDPNNEWKGCQAQGAFFRRANLESAVLHSCVLTDTDFRAAQLTNADLRSADLRQACLVRANLQGADLRGADLRYADLSGARVARIRYDRNMRCFGATVDHTRGDGGFARMVQELRAIEELEQQQPLLANVLRWFSDYGRSHKRLGAIVCGVTLLFSTIYVICPNLVDWSSTFLGSHSCAHSRYLCGTGWVSAGCYALSNMMTLGFASIGSTSGWGAPVAVLNAMFGFFFLGVLAAGIAERIRIRG